MVTPLQYHFSRSRIIRRAMLQYFAADGKATGTGYKLLWYDIISHVCATMTEAQIKRCLYSFMRCYDVTPEERAEIKQLLQLAQTALTEDQRRQLLSSLPAQ